MHRKNTMGYLPFQTGFNFIEILVVSVILSVGLLGFFKMYALTYKVTAHTAMTTTANRLAYNLAEHIQSHSSASTHYVNNLGHEQKQCFSLSGCSTKDMISHFIWQWQKDLALQLPMGQGTVCRGQLSTLSNATISETPKNFCTSTGTELLIIIEWDQNGDGELSNTDATIANQDGLLYITVAM